MRNIVQYMKLASPYELTIETSINHNTIGVKLYDLANWETVYYEITHEEYEGFSSDLIEVVIDMLKIKLTEKW